MLSCRQCWCGCRWRNAHWNRLSELVSLISFIGVGMLTLWKIAYQSCYWQVISKVSAIRIAKHPLAFHNSHSNHFWQSPCTIKIACRQISCLIFSKLNIFESTKSIKLSDQAVVQKGSLFWFKSRLCNRQSVWQYQSLANTKIISQETSIESIETKHPESKH